ncbi:DNA replication ATP-dependent helicase/nuclease DNA2 [Chanos chanos]|uniref:DNA replication ATP-dependent helicase/nuclease n=1 Tax=Chanos chanos TaxID=29144 RepID=A0A6J2V8J1_CHACN|nr:DNA replication ATP-dependent helicase/nuclease DNA2 [Chanos chanos]
MCSPVSRFRTALKTGRPMQALGNMCLQAVDPQDKKSGAVCFGSVKRLMFGLDEPQKAKRSRTMPVKRPSSPVKSFNQSDSLNEFLQAIRDSKDTKAKRTQKPSPKEAEKTLVKAEQVLFKSSESSLRDQVTVRAMTSRSKLQGLNGTFLKQSSGVTPKCRSSENEKTNLFTLITKQKVDVTDGEHGVSHSGSETVEKEDCVLRCPVTDKRPMKNEGHVVDGTSVPEDELSALNDSWFDEKMEQNSGEPKHKKSNSKKKESIPGHVILATGLYNRYWVLDVKDIEGSQDCTEKHLTVTASKTTEPAETCILRDGWESSPVSVGDIVHLEGTCVSGVWLIDGESGFLVVLPDMLISGTSIASSIRCLRRAVLAEMFKAFDGGSRQMLNGTIVHEIFQKAAKCLDFSPETIQRLATETLHSPDYLSQMYGLNLTQADMRQEVEEYLPSLSNWASGYLQSSPEAGQKPLTLKLPSEGTLSRQDTTCTVAVTEFVDIEENIWSPRFGLKGKIDVTAGVRIQRRGRARLDRIMPLELKTGRESNSIEHRSQVILYTLMSLERRPDPEAGLLLYLKTGNLHPVVGKHLDRRELIKLRNLLAHHLGNSLVTMEGKTHMAPLPPVISDSQACRHCAQRKMCAVYNRAEEQAAGQSPSEPAQTFLQEETQHLLPAHLHYFSHWLLLCTMEASTMERKGGRQHIWLQSAREREQTGGCVGNMVRTGMVSTLSEGVYSHSFERRGQDRGVAGIITGDRIVVSDQDSKVIGIATGYVTGVTSSGVKCSLDRNLSRYPADTVFRLDQDEGGRGLSSHLRNLSMLMENSPTSGRLRELIVDFRPPEFIENLSNVLPRDAKDIVANILRGLNKPQKQAMKKVLLSKDYTLIVGMPGTGKTTTICTLVRILHACGFSVLLTSYTHSAVDNILLKLKKFKIGFLRLGRVQKVHPDIVPFTEDQCRGEGIQTVAELGNLYNKELVVASTCMGVNHPIFTRRRFDFCIVDEASQISQPVCLGPLFFAQRFVLVGDHQQLPPIVQNTEARALGMDESLFKRLERHSHAVVRLTVQYRMNRAIMALSNTLMYDGKLECGSEKTASATLQLPSRDVAWREVEEYVCQPEYSVWIQSLLEPDNPVCFLDTCQVPATEIVETGGVSNPTEAKLVHAIISLLLKAGCRGADIGVIAPYRQQLKAISGLLGAPALRAVEVNTVDKYQGRDKSVIIVSFVRSHLDANLGELLKDWRRLNVAVTRAKHKLIMLGCVPTLRRYAPLEKLLDHLRRENMISQLPPAAHEALPVVHL